MTRFFRFSIFAIVTVFCCLYTNGLLAQKTDSLRYPIKDRRGDKFTWRYNNPFDLRDTSLIKQDIIYDPATKQYYIVEKIGNTVYRKSTLTFDEFLKLQSSIDEDNYFNERSRTLFDLNRKIHRPKPIVYNQLFDRIFGVGPNGLKVDIKPEGNIDLIAGYQGQNIKNPTLPEAARKTGGFDFNMNANVNINANIGDKLKLPISYNTLANFDFENQLKLDYKGKDDEILKSVEAGNISFQAKGTLMASVQSLFGLKTQLQFGKLFITTAIANQKSQRQSVTLQGGGLNQIINKKLDDYDENRHFLMGQYFVNNYDKTMKNLPYVNSQVQILRLEVWVTNRNGATTNTRNIVGFMDLAENDPYNKQAINSLTTNPLPFNGANDLYSFLTNSDVNRNPAMVNTILLGKGLTPVNDFEKTFARKLDPSEYYFNPQVGFISLNQQLQPDDVLAIAYQYTYNGKVFQVGEFSQDVTVDSTQGVQKVLFLKLLKATSQRPNLPLWNLMMKNVYSLDVTGLQPDGFNINVLYQEPSGGLKRYLPVTDPDYSGKPLLSILNLDRLNNRNDPLPDGQFDYVDSFTVLPQQGKIIFPVLKPFGDYLDTTAFANQPPDVKNQYLYPQLYDSIKAIAQTYANLDRFYIQGTIKGSSTTDIYLGGFNIPPGSVSVTAGGQILQENVDYIIDYNLGTLKVINQAILNSGVPVNVQYENNASFGIQQRSFFGLRLDYLVNKKLSIGATMQRLTERPFFTKVNYGEDPIQNRMYGVDFNYNSELPGLTRLLNKLPFYDSKTVSTINAYGEAAVLSPGHPKQIGKGDEGLIYIDDFEGTTSSIDLRFPFVAWTLASTPQTSQFPEAFLTNNLDYGKNRAKLAWYNIEPTLQDKNSPNNPLKGNLAALSDPRVRAVYTNELFPQRTTNITDVLNGTFDLAFYPDQLGPYNFTSDQGNIGTDGKLRNPKQRWGGIMRNIDQTDFETGNIEFIEFWVQNPFIKDPTSTGGKLLINLGNISEDVLKDGLRFYENGLETPTQPAAVDATTSVWGTVPVNPIQVTQAFSNDPADRPYQDVGFDGLSDTAEQIKQSKYLQDLATNFGTGSAIYQNAIKDPSHDDYKWYRDASYDAVGADILERYKDHNNPQGNSPIATGSSQFSPATTLYPDNEDLNRDNTLNESEEYYEYEIDLKPGMDINNTKYITDVRTIHPRYADGSTGEEQWYLFRIPIKNYTSKIGQIPDFKSIRFIRMYMTGFEDSVVMRFASLDLVRNQWRTFTYELDTTGSYTPLPANSPTTMNVLAVNIEENSGREPIPYKIPPGIERVQLLGNNGVNLLQNEQSMSLKLNNVTKGESRAVFKTLNLDLRQYGQLSMFIHNESVIGQRPLNVGDFVAVIRIGQDFLNNYYEVRIPLTPTAFGETMADKIWPDSNNLNIALNELVQLKLRRNSNSANSISRIYREQFGAQTISVLGNPNLAEVQGFLIGIQNASGETLSTEVWVNELRLSKIDESGGWAALGRADIQLADLGTLSVSANTYTAGFGTIEQRANERARDNMLQYDIALNVDAGKLLPRNSGITVPVYASLNKTILTPEYDPYDKDVRYKYKLATAGDKRDSIKNVALDETTIKTLNLTNIRFGQNVQKNRLWNLKNFDFTYSFTHFEQTNPLILLNSVNKTRFGLGYTYTGTAKYIEPFKKLIKNKTPWLALIRDFNVNPVPSLLSFRADINRQFGKYTPRIVNTFDSKVERVDTTYDKFFTFDRYYNLRWDLTHSFNADFSATNYARVDEPYGLLNTSSKKDTVRRNFFSGGRTTVYQQRVVLSYNAPLAKLPATDWISIRYSYTTTYNWAAASLLARNLGNIIENSQQNALNGEFDFTKLYSKSPWLDKMTQPNDEVDNATPANDSTIIIKPREEVIKDLKGKAKREALRKWRGDKRAKRKLDRKNRTVTGPSGVAKTAVGLVTMVKRASINYSANFNSRIPGYTDSTKILGQNWQSMQPGLGYVFGKQPDTAWLNDKSRRGLISRDSTFNLLFAQDYEQHLSFSAQLEPFREFTIDVNLDKTFTKNYTELFKDTTGTGDHFGHLSPLAGGGFSVSYISFQTLFKKYKPTEVSETFKKFQDNRITIAGRLAKTNPYYDGTTSADGFPTGYGRYAQDVLIPAFLAAYTNKDPNSIGLISQSNPNIKSNPFSGVKPLPNWRVTYTGLTRIPAISNVFSNITISHAYNSTLSMNSFTSALLFEDPFDVGKPKFIDPISGNYVPFYLVPNITIQEQFEPLFGVDMTTANQTSFRFAYKKSRQLSLSLVDYQLAEVRSTEWTFGGSLRSKNVKLPIKLPFIKNTDQGNDLNISLDLSMRDDIQSNSRLDQATAYGTGGQKVITIQPSIDYVVSNRVDLKLYFDQQRITPYISTSAPSVNTRAGLQIRISLAPNPQPGGN